MLISTVRCGGDSVDTCDTHDMSCEETEMHPETVKKTKQPTVQLHSPWMKQKAVQECSHLGCDGGRGRRQGRGVHARQRLQDVLRDRQAVRHLVC